MHPREVLIARLIYTTICSLDGFIEDVNGQFDWAAPDEEVHQFINDLERSAHIHLYGRRMYQTLMVWETDPSLAADSPITRDFAGIWQAAEKIVFSRTLQAVSTRKTRIERTFKPAAIQQLKKIAQQNILIGGAALAAEAFRAGLIDEIQLFLTPILVGGGKPALPKDIKLELELIGERNFANGMVYLRYQKKKPNTD